MTYQEILKQLYDRKCDQGYTLEAIGQASGIDRSSVARMFNGDTTMRVSTFFQVVESLNFKISSGSQTTYPEILNQLIAYYHSTKLTLAELSQKTGVSKSTLSRMFRKEGEVSASAFLKAAECLNIELCDLHKMDEDSLPIDDLELADDSKLAAYQKIERFLEWKQCKKALLQAHRNLRKCESFLTPSEISEFEKKYKKDKRNIRSFG